MTATTTATTTATPTHRRRPLSALARAEYLQFRRNRTLLFLGTVFPVGLPLVTFFASRNGTDDPTRVFTALEMFTLTALLFVQYYSVLSMITTRRGEGVLKRLRTGEASDRQILTAPAVPGVVLTFLGAVVVGAAVYADGVPAPVNVLALAFGLVAGLIVFTLLALATSAMTKNAEAAQITSLPVIVVAMIGLGSIREALPEKLARIAEWTPFAAISDLVSLGATGKTATAADSTKALDFAGTFAETVRPLGTLAGWAVVALILVVSYFKWDDRG